MIALALLAQLLSPAVSCRADATLGEVCTLSRAEAADECRYYLTDTKAACEAYGGTWDVDVCMRSKSMDTFCEVVASAPVAEQCQWVRHGQASREACEDLGGAWFDDSTCGGRDDAQERLCVALFGEE